MEHGGARSANVVGVPSKTQIFSKMDQIQARTCRSQPEPAVSKTAVPTFIKKKLTRKWLKFLKQGVCCREKDVGTTWGEAEEEGEKGGCLTAPQKNEKGGKYQDSASPL